MIPSIINVSLYTLILYLWYRQGRYNLGTMIIPIMYTVTAIMCMVTACVDPKMWHLTLIPFLYMFFIYIILLTPFKRLAQKEIKDVTIRNEKLIRNLSYFFIVFALYSAYSTFTLALEALQSGDWLAVRNQMYYGEEREWTAIQRICLNGNDMMHILAEIWMFYIFSSFCKKKYSMLYKILLVIAVFLPVLVSAVANAARGVLFYMVLEAFIIYYIFNGYYTRSFNRVITVLSSLLLIISLILSIAISFSRFDDDSSSQLMYYFGHSMNSFNYGVMDTIHSYMGGRFFLGDYYKFFSSGPTEIIDADMALGTHFGTSFITIIGCLYIDFGPFFTIIVAILIAAAFSHKKMTKSTYFSDLYLYAVYASLIAEGVFVEGRTYGMKLIIKFLIYLLISYKFAINRREVHS